MDKILVVDDKESVRDILFIFLTNKFNFSCCLAENGSQGLELFQRESPDLVITDINMPVMNGKEMVEKIRSSGSLVPVIFMSGIVENFQGLENVCNSDFVEKLIDLEDLLAKIKNLLS